MNQRGVVTAFVDEVDAKQGRVKVEYKAIEDKLLSPWAYIAAPMSGKGRGALFMPEKGDEVLVCFGDGQFGHPYVVGFLWNGEQVSPEKEAHNRVIVTPGGHQLRFEDKKDDTRVILKSNGRHALTMEDKAAGPQVLLKSNDGRELLLDDMKPAGKVRIKSIDNQILMDDLPAGTKIELKAGKGVGVTITLNATPQPSLSIAVGAGNTIDVSSSGVSLTAAGNLSVTTAGVSSVSIGGASTVTVGGAANIVVGGAASITAGGAASITAGGAVAISAAGAATITASAVSVNAALTTVSGVLQAATVITNSVVSASYTPGAGNLL